MKPSGKTELDGGPTRRSNITAEYVSAHGSVVAVSPLLLWFKYNRGRHIPAQSWVLLIRCNNRRVGNIALLVLTDRVDACNLARHLQPR